MKYVITESQYKLITEKEKDVLYIPSVDAVGGPMNLLKFLERRGYPDYSLGGFLNLTEKKVESIGNCISIEESLYLMQSKPIKTLGKLKYVGIVCDLFESSVESLGDLEYVGSFLDIRHTKIESIGNLTYIGTDFYVAGTPLAKKYTKEEIRDRIKIKGELVMV